ncbi:nucleotidyl transferase AbiEii/AbiGii toxin family protein [Streptomyces sp. NPDC048603]|uniref:nucleotidyl transferase AbiEii/AbiGii toxin family protein n=1 Tax=Streptomyces sp. NPDC048603 TaxID=3365577 RepID=UPI00372081A0
MRLTGLHRRLLAAVIDIGSDHPLVLAGGYAVQAHGLVDRLSQDLDVATQDPAPMAEIAARLQAGLAERGWRVRLVDADPLAARLMVTDPVTGEDCAVDLLKEHFWTSPVDTEYGPVLALDTVIGTKVRALADRGLARDLIDVHAAARLHGTRDLERLGARHARDDGFLLEDLRDRLSGSEWIDDEEFGTYGLDGAAIGELRAWALDWAADLDRRLHHEPDGTGGTDGTDGTDDPGGTDDPRPHLR